MKLNEVTQRRLECYQERLIELGENTRSAAAFNRIVIESAVDAGIAEATPDDLGNLSPRAVHEMTKRVLEHIKEAQAPLSGEA
ncbi:MAG: hypothetical protein GF364_22740 [Candidatus Lokiarchaeota archaeon]|nr:hypothetical protein [Candidatus Lokiarchaeota archaeon]